MQGYVFLSEFLLRLEHDSDPESSEAIRYGYRIVYRGTNAAVFISVAEPVNISFGAGYESELRLRLTFRLSVQLLNDHKEKNVN